MPFIETGEVGVDAGGVGQVEQASLRPEAQGAWQVDFAVFEAEVAALERAQAITGQAVLAGLQLDRQRQVFEAQTRWHMVEDLYLQRLRKVVFDRQLHLAPSTQRQAAG
ncbi:hypothetical protein D3C78_1269720 [compost metagenome]